MDDLSTAVKQQPWIELEQPPAASRTGFGIIGGLFGLILVVAVVAMSLRGGHTDAAVEPADAAPAASQPDAACATRLHSIMDAVIAYQEAHGEPPATLSALHPEFLSFAPTAGDAPDPYGYRVIGQTISLSCPQSGANTAN